MKTDLPYLGHMLDAAKEASDIAATLTRAQFDSDRIVRFALVHLLQVVGEAARRVSHASRIASPAIPWDAIVGMRNRLVHDYLNVNNDVVWNTLQDDLPLLIGQLHALVDSLKPDKP